ncbi:MAG: 50S ribosomal protein L35 [Dehalococcoidia bacterium]|nr:50S ribosomal protein L35 [Dehalococcoidia bacterium]
MPKLKTHKGAAKRFHITGTGKILRLKSHSTHLRSTKSKSVKRQFGDKLEVSHAFTSRIKRLLPYGTGKR